MRRALVVLLLAAAPVGAAAQSSQFGVRGLGMPGRSLSTTAFGTGGAYGSSTRARASIRQRSAAHRAHRRRSALQDSGMSEPGGHRVAPGNAVPVPVRGGADPEVPGVVGLSFSNYTSRDFTLATADTIILRDVLVPVSDTLSSRGGLSDLRFAGAYRVQDTWVFGGSFHVITGSARLRFRRSFADTT